MKLFILVLILLTDNSLAQTIPLPNVDVVSRQVLSNLKDNPLIHCVQPKMFTSQSPLLSSKQISNCVQNDLINLKDKTEHLIKDSNLNINTLFNNFDY